MPPFVMSLKLPNFSPLLLKFEECNFHLKFSHINNNPQYLTTIVMTWPKPSFNKKFYNCSKLWILSIVQAGYSQVVLSSYGMLKAFKLVQNLIYMFFSSPKVVFSHSKLSSNGSKCYNTRKKEPWQPRSCIEEIWLTISVNSQVYQTL